MSTAYPLSPKVLIERLGEAGYSPHKVEALLGKRISYRALYRWRTEQTAPQRAADYWAVYRLAESLNIDLH